MKQQDKTLIYQDQTVPRIQRIQQLRKQRRDKIQQPALEFLKNLEKFNLQYYYQQNEGKTNNIYYGITQKQVTRSSAASRPPRPPLPAAQRRADARSSAAPVPLPSTTGTL